MDGKLARRAARTGATSAVRPGGASRSIVALLGDFWLCNAGFQFLAWAWPRAQDGKSGLAQALAKAVIAAPAWLHPLVQAIATGIDRIGAEEVAIAMVVVAVLLGLSLISGAALRIASCFGIAYSMFCWIALCALGAPYGNGQTDPGVFPAYMIAFVFVLAVAPMVHRRPATQHFTRAAPSPGLWLAAQLLFGLLWAFDAILKWEPYFIAHFLDQLTPAVQGQPHWIAVYITFVIGVVEAIGPKLIAVIVAIIETGIAVSLLTGILLPVVAPLAFLYSLAVWTTAEGWGGPYTLAGTGIRGDVLGNVLIYAVIFLFLMVPTSRLPRAAAT